MKVLKGLNMGSNLVCKFRILLRSVRLLRNWYFYPLMYFKLINKKHVILETRNGIKIKLRIHSTDIFAFIHVWILQEYNKKGFEINDKDIIIDIGAHIGLFALYASQFCKTGKIYCFEPIEENFDLLVSNLKLNNIKNVIATRSAVSHKTGNVTIYLNQDESAHSMYVPASKSVQVQSVSVKDIIDFNNLEKCDLIKIDCEGSEYEIINSLPVTYFDKINKMCIEYHFASEKPFLVSNLIGKLKSLSYSVNTRAISNNIGFLYALKT